MSDQVVTGLLGRAGLSFIGTVTQVGAATLPAIPVNDHTVVVRVDRVLDAPPSFAHLANQEVTVLLAPNAAPVGAGQQLALFTNISALGSSLAVTEVGRLAPSEVQPHLASAAAQPLATLRAAVSTNDFRTHADAAEVVVVGRISSLEQVEEERYSEHAPHYWRATLEVQHVEKGSVSGQQLTFIFPASQDVRWANAPKPQPRQQGMWILHATAGAASSLAPYELLHPDDFGPVQQLERLRPPAR